jgi:hypothetical protein
MKSKNFLLILAGIFSFGVAIFQAAISIVPEWSAVFGAGDELLSNPPLLLVAGLGMSLVFATCGFYALSGAGVIRRLPLLRLGLFLIGMVYLFRGFPSVLLFLVMLNVLPSPGPVSLPYLLVFLVSLVIGLTYWIGLAVGWKQMKTKTLPAMA